MSRHALAISLGHNSSAVAIIDGQIVCGYEQERFSQIKSDSAYPVDAINECIKMAHLPVTTDVYIGHWFLNGELPEKSNKYINFEHLTSRFPLGQRIAVSKQFTHHDSHVWSALPFAAQGEGLGESYHALVMDGFGTHGEVISVYKVEGNNVKLTHRWFGFEKSLGMFYQYATSYLEMKMHNHEYKILAYENHIHDTAALAVLDVLIDQQARMWSEKWFANLNTLMNETYDPLINLDALPNIQAEVHRTLDQFLLQLGFSVIDLQTKRIVVSRFVQKCVEYCTVNLVASLQADNLLVVGGLFYNVKINSLISNHISGKLCVMPLAGDQGAALGVYHGYNGDLQWPGHLAWGRRTLHEIECEGVVYFNHEYDAHDFIHNQLEQNGKVNVVRGAMEYGPRALCNTSTLAIPDLSITSEINNMNLRTNEMPMAPVMTVSQADEYFKDVNNIHQSLDYMIVTRDYKNSELASNVLGAAHYYKDKDVYTGRPQITREPFMTSLLDEFGPLVNTSFNFHGVPIVFDTESIIQTHKSQMENASKPFYTVIIQGK
jgi:predicted NodU family carbamoyl transferase